MERVRETGSVIGEEQRFEQSKRERKKRQNKMNYSLHSLETKDDTLLYIP
jgi:hypothetical protein